jgi:biotin transporter BioY
MRKTVAASYNVRMYIIAIGWLWVVLLMAITESNIVAGILTFTFYGLLPCSLLMWLLATPARRKRLKEKTAADEAPPPEDRS